MTEQSKESGKSLRYVYYTLFRHKLLIAVTFGAISLLVAYQTLTAPKVYEAEAKVEVGVGRESLGLDPTLVDDPRLSVFQSREYEINQEIAELTSRAHVGRVVDVLSPEYVLGRTDRLPLTAVSYLGIAEPEAAGAGSPAGMDGGSGPLPSPVSALKRLLRPVLTRLKISSQVSLREQAIGRFMASFTVSSRYNSDVLNLGYRDNLPERAYRILSATIQLHLQSPLPRRSSSESYAFFLSATEQQEKDLQATEQAMRALRDRYGIVSVADQKTAMVERLNGLQQERDSVEADIASSEAAIRVMEKNLDPQFYAEQAKLQSLQARRQVLLPQIRQLEAELQNLNDVEFRIRQLERKIEVQEQTLQKYQQNLELARTNQALEQKQITNLTILQDPMPPEEPVSPNPRRNIPLGMLLGLLVGVALAFAREKFDMTLRSPQDIQAIFQAASVISVPLVRAGKVRRAIHANFDRRLRTGFHPEVLFRNVVAWFEILPEVREPFLQLKDDLMATLDSRQSPYILALTSYGRGEGVSTVATGLAYVLTTLEELKVLLVDANLHHPEDSRFHGMGRPTGLHELSVNQLRTGAGLVGAPDGPLLLTDRPSGLLTQLELSKTISHLVPVMEKHNHRVILLDLPSVGEGSAAVKTAAQANGTLLVIQSEKVNRESIRHMKERIEKAGGRVVGIVLNKRRYYIPRFLYR